MNRSTFALSAILACVISMAQAQANIATASPPVQSTVEEKADGPRVAQPGGDYDDRTITARVANECGIESRLFQNTGLWPASKKGTDVEAWLARECPRSRTTPPVRQAAADSPASAPPANGMAEPEYVDDERGVEVAGVGFVPSNFGGERNARTRRPVCKTGKLVNFRGRPMCNTHITDRRITYQPKYGRSRSAICGGAESGSLVRVPVEGGMANYRC